MSIIRGFAAIGRGLAGLFKTGGILGTGEAGAAAAFTGLGASALSWFGLGIAGWLGSHRGEIVTALLSPFKDSTDALKAWLRKNLTFDGILDTLGTLLKTKLEELKAVLWRVLDEFIPAPLRRYLESKGYIKPVAAEGTTDAIGQPGAPATPVGSKTWIGSAMDAVGGVASSVGHRVARAFGFGGDSGRIGKAQQGANASAVMSELKAAGYGDNAIAAIMGSMQTESGFRPGVVNGSGHTGLWQWDGAKRWPKIAAWIKAQGGDPKDARWQTKAWIAEHNAKPGDALYDGAQTARGGAILKSNPSLADAITGVRLSERFGQGEEGGRAANARAWLPHVQGGTVPGSMAGDSGDVGQRIASLKSAGVISNEQCVALAKAYVGVSGSVRDWRRGVGAADGTLKPGTPVATFLNRDGSASERYAGGGTGTPGAHLDHAAVFEKYIPGKDGKPIGMRVAEQYAGSGGPKEKDYFFGKGFGEANGSNYHAIKSAVEGAYLGGKNNPMNRIEPPTPAGLADSVGSAASRTGDAAMGNSFHHSGDNVFHMGPGERMVENVR